MRPAHGAQAQAQLAQASLEQPQRIEVRGPHFADCGRRLASGLAALKAQPKSGQRLLQLRRIARRIPLMGAQGMAGDGR